MMAPPAIWYTNFVEDITSCVLATALARLWNSIEGIYTISDKAKRNFRGRYCIWVQPAVLRCNRRQSESWCDPTDEHFPKERQSKLKSVRRTDREGEIGREWPVWSGSHLVTFPTLLRPTAAFCLFFGWLAVLGQWLLHEPLLLPPRAPIVCEVVIHSILSIGTTTRCISFH